MTLVELFQRSWSLFLCVLLRKTTLASIASTDSYVRWAKDRGHVFSHSRLLSKSHGAILPTSPASNDAETVVALHWKILAGKRIHIAVAVEATGWVALGFAEMGGMSGADIVLFEASSGKIQDLYSVAYERPKIDPQQDWTLIHSGVDGGLIIFEAERLLDTGDNLDWPLTDDTNLLQVGTKVLAAWGETSEMHYHGPDNRMQAAVRFFADSNFYSDQDLYKTTMSRESEGSVSMYLENFTVPDRYTTWYEWKCITVKELVEQQGLPKDKPVHLIGFEFDLVPGSLVHHIVVYSGIEDKIAKCNPYKGPTSAMHVWNKGQSKTFFFPDDVGMLLADQSDRGGKGLGIPPKSFRLEVHFENQKRIKNSQDSSGVRLHYTTKLRQHTGATMELADPQVKLIGQKIGDGLRRHEFSCPDSCTQAHLPSQGVTVLYQLMHMHKAGLTMQIAHERQGQKSDISSVEYYDVGSGGQITRTPYTILPGDKFTTICTYRGSKKLEFGYQADREMCLGAVFYYPASTSAHMSCTSSSSVKECVSKHSATTLPGPSSLARKFGVSLPTNLTNLADFSPNVGSSFTDNEKDTTLTMNQIRAQVPVPFHEDIQTSAGGIFSNFNNLLFGVGAILVLTSLLVFANRARKRNKGDEDEGETEFLSRACSPSGDNGWFNGSSSLRSRSRITRVG